MARSEGRSENKEKNIRRINTAKATRRDRINKRKYIKNHKNNVILST